MNRFIFGTYLIDKDVVANAIQQAYEVGGITRFDTAQIYGNEQETGTKLTEFKDVQVTTKIRKLSDEKGTIKIIAKSEKKLPQLSSIILHHPLPAVSWNTLEQYSKKYKIGVSNYSTKELEMMKKYATIMPDVNQIEFSLTHHSAMHDGTLDYMLTCGIRPMAWSPLGSVFREDNEQTRRIHKQLGALLDKYKATEDQLLLAWTLNHPSGIIPVVGTTNKERLKLAMEAAKINFELEDWFLILVACQGHKVP